MSNPYYDHASYPGPNAPGSSAALRAELDKVESGFDKMPALSGNGNKVVVVKGDGSGLDAVSSIAANVTGNFTGNVTGDVNGNVTGNVTATTGTSNFNNVNLTGSLTGVPTPVSNTDAANKAYVDSVAQGLDTKASCRVATTSNITLSGTQTIDGVAVTAGDRVLVKNQSAASQNGIYVVAVGAWARSTDMDAWAEFPGAFVFVEDGTANDNSGWVCTVAPSGTIGSTSITFEQFSGAGQINAGAGLTKTGNTLDVGTASSARIVVNANDIDLAQTGVSAGTYNQLTVDIYGRVVSAVNDSFAALYLGPKASAPTVDNQGNPLLVGALYFDTTLNKMRVYVAGGSWADAGSSVNGTSARAVYVATAGQTTFAITYDVGFVDVYLNGVKLVSGTEFVASSGTSIVLSYGAAAGDTVDIVAYGTFAVANTYTQAQTNTLLAAKQDVLVSGTSIKTINGSAVLGSGDLVIQGFTLAQAQATSLSF